MSQRVTRKACEHETEPFHFSDLPCKNKIKELQVVSLLSKYP